MSDLSLIQLFRRWVQNSFLFNLCRRPRLTLLSLLNRKAVILNDKQKAWLDALSMIADRPFITMLETGRARNRHWSYTDGNSTFFFAHLNQVGRLISIDNDSENQSGFSGTREYCEHYLPARDRKVVELVNGDSVTEINRLPEGLELDFVLLDSANDPELIFREYQAAKRMLSPKGAVVCVDDVYSPGIKGDTLVPYLIAQGYKEQRYKAEPGGCSIFFIMPTSTDREF